MLLNQKKKKIAVCSAIAATGVTALVTARGHRIDRIPEIPFVVSDDVQSNQKTKQAVEFLKRIKAIDDVLKVKKSRTLRAGKGKARNRRFKEGKGPLLIYSLNNGLTKAFRNIKGLETMCVNRLNLLSLAPGSQVGRFIIWTESAFKQLHEIFGSYDNKVVSKYGFRGQVFKLPRPLMLNTDLDKLIQSDEIQSVIRPYQIQKRLVRKKNPLKNFYALVKLNPHALTLKRLQVRRKEKLLQLANKPDEEMLKERKLTETNKAIKKKFFEKIFDFQGVGEKKE